MYYIDNNGVKTDVTSFYHISIEKEIIKACKPVFDGIRSGWFKDNVKYPNCVFYLVSSSLSDYVSNTPNKLTITYTFEARGYDNIALSQKFNDLRYELSKLYNARERKLPQSFGENSYVERTDFIFTIKIGA